MRLRVLIWTAVALAVVGAGVAWVLVTQMRPSYDAYGWMVWGQQILHGSLNTDGAPSWKPLTFVFSVPYALFGHDQQMWLWLVTAASGTLTGGVFAARIAYRLTCLLYTSDAADE